MHKQQLGLGFCINRKVSLSVYVRMLAAVNVQNHYIGYCGYLCFTTSKLNSLIEDVNSIDKFTLQYCSYYIYRAPLMYSTANSSLSTGM